MLNSLLSQPESFQFFYISNKDIFIQKSLQKIKDINEIAFSEVETIENLENLGIWSDYCPKIMESIISSILNKVSQNMVLTISGYIFSKIWPW